MVDKCFSRVKYCVLATGWLVGFMILTEFATRFLVMYVPPLKTRIDGGGIEIYAREGYGIIRYEKNYEIASPYSDGEVIIVLGDSYTHARQVPWWRNYTSVAERTLRAQGWELDLKNFGYMGQSLPYYIGIAPELIGEYSPRLIVIQAGRGDFLSPGILDVTKPFYFALETDGTLTLQKNKNKGSHFTHQQRIVSFPLLFFTDLTNLSIVKTIRLREGERREREGIQLSISEDAWGEIDSTDILRQEIGMLEAQYGQIPIIFIIRPTFDRTTLRFKYTKEDWRLISTLESHADWHVVRLDEAFNASLQKGISPIGFGNTSPFSGHWNVHGHAIVGSQLAEEIIHVLESARGMSK